MAAFFGWAGLALVLSNLRIIVFITTKAHKGFHEGAQSKCLLMKTLVRLCENPSSPSW